MQSGIIITVGGKADSELTNAATVEVNERQGETTTFSLRFDFDISDGDFPFIKDERLLPGSDISILVSVDDAKHSLVKGPVHGHNIHFEHGGAGSWIEILGSDSSVKMDRETRSVVWSDVKDSEAVISITGNYGYATDIETTNAGHFVNKHTLVQCESDLAFVRRLARRNGFLFWISSDETGIETAHFRRPELDTVTEGEIIINLQDANISFFDLDWNIERPLSIRGTQLDLNTKSEIEVAVDKTPLTVLGEKGFDVIAGENNSVHLSAPVDDAGNLRARGEGALIEAGWFIHGRCETTLENTGKLIRPVTVVDLKGLGSLHSGKYYVSGVKHKINAVEHIMEIELLRNGWGV